MFWIGDLNYRLTLSDLEMVYERISAQDWNFLLSHDQLLLEKSSGRAFSGYREGRIMFPPTYKYQQGTHLYERRPEKKNRFPAWCDRIMWTRYRLHTNHDTHTHSLISDCIDLEQQEQSNAYGYQTTVL